jgi:hypothetical protein
MKFLLTTLLNLTLLLTLAIGSALPDSSLPALAQPDSIPARSASSAADDTTGLSAFSSRQGPEDAAALLLNINALETRQQGSCGSPFEYSPPFFPPLFSPHLPLLIPCPSLFKTKTKKTQTAMRQKRLSYPHACPPLNYGGGCGIASCFWLRPHSLNGVPIKQRELTYFVNCPFL